MLTMIRSTIDSWSLMATYLGIIRCRREVYLEPSQTCKTDLYLKLAKGFRLLSVFSENSILDVRLSYGYASVE